jgi:cytochrome c oxidase subunit 2
MRRIFIAVLVLSLAVLSIAAMPQGEDHDGHGSGGHGMDMGNGGNHDKNAPVVPGTRQIKVKATSFRFAPKQITVQAGEDVTIVLTSKDVFHDFMVQGIGHVVGAKKGKTAKGGLTIDRPGTYKFWCSVSGHRGAGMKGTIVVQ